MRTVGRLRVVLSFSRNPTLINSYPHLSTFSLNRNKSILHLGVHTSNSNHHLTISKLRLLLIGACINYCFRENARPRYPLRHIKQNKKKSASKSSVTLSALTRRSRVTVAPVSTIICRQSALQTIEHTLFPRQHIDERRETKRGYQTVFR